MITNPSFAAIDAWIADYVDSGKLPFAHVKITRGETTLYEGARGFADVKSGRAYQRDDLIRIFSLSKIVTAVAILQLIDDGVLGLDQDVAEILPEFAQTPIYDPTTGGTRPRKGPITIRHLLTHSAGLSYAQNEDAIAPLYQQAGLVLFYQDTLARFSEVLAQQPLLFQPGERYYYSTAFGLLGRVVEVAGRMPFAQALEQRIFAPLGMTDTAFDVAPEQLDRLVTLYEFAPERNLRVLETNRASSWKQQDRDVFFDGGGGLVSTVEDFARFMDMLRRDGTGDKGERVLSQASVKALQTDQLGRTFAQMDVTDNGHYPLTDAKGLGVYVVTSSDERASPWAIGEFGWSGAASLISWVNPRLDISVVFATQLFPSDTFPLYPELNALVYGALHSA